MRHKFNWHQICLFLCYFWPISSLSSEQFTETLLIKPLPNGDLFTLFNFTIFAHQEHENSGANATGHRPILVPSLLQHLANQFGITDLHLSIAQGFWRPRIWGAQMPGTEVPSGNELIAKFGTAQGANFSRSETHEDDERKWARLVHTLNGLFCTSMLQLVPQHSSKPKLVFQNGASASDDEERWFWGTLGGESVCTENIKAWKNLLPCKQNGLVSLMDPIELLSAKFHAISLKLAQIGPVWHFSMLFRTVHSGEMSREKATKGIPLIKSLFGRELTTECPIVSKSSVIIVQNELFGLKMPAKNSSKIDNQNFVEFAGAQQINKIGTFHHKSPNFHALQIHTENIIVHSHIKSVNQIGGRISTQIVNPLQVPLVNALFAHQIPWHLRIFLHTLEMKCQTANGIEKPSFELSSFTLARDRARPLLMELTIGIPAMSKCVVNVDYEAAFLRIADFPPDASSGIFVPGALLQIPLAHNPMLMQTMHETFPTPLDIGKSQWVRVFGEPLLVLLPIPDFSMPFNVICLVCTAIAIFYGNAFALSTKIMVPVPKKGTPEVGTGIRRQGILAQLRCKFVAKIGTIRQIFQRRPKEEKNE
ncbi:hypothetical protein niasHT_010626 [Heterodera trifolii]|uniref:GPI transamidase component PIG-T n=1 Tax=Heterodera trifolii TaxID=157864 RepID=A0ABD2L2P0_9BILA